MVDLDSTQILNADDSILQDVPILDKEASIKIVSGFESNTHSIKKETVIGRASPSDLVIPAQSLSKQHARITINNGQYFITDLGSSNKTYQNKVQLQPNVCYALHNGDEVKLGDLVCTFHEEKLNKEKDNNAQSINTEAIPSTQAISDSYDEEEPTQPIKIWNGNGNNINHISRTSGKSSEDLFVKKNGVEEAPSNGSSLFSTVPLDTAPINDHDDGSLVIGSSTVPATVPLEVASTELNEENQVEIVSTTQTKTTIEENIENDTMTIETKTTTTTKITTEIEIDNNQNYSIEPIAHNIDTVETDIQETQAYNTQIEPIIVQDVTETKKEKIHKVVVDGDDLMEETTTIKVTSTKTTTVIETVNQHMETQAYDLEPVTETVSIETKTKEMCLKTQIYEMDPTSETVSSETQPNEMHMETQAYDLEPTKESLSIVTTTKETCLTTQTYDLEPANETVSNEAKTDEMNMETQAYDLESTKEPITIVTTTNETLLETQVYDLEPTKEPVQIETETKDIVEERQTHTPHEQIDKDSTVVANEKTELVTKENNVQTEPTKASLNDGKHQLASNKLKTDSDESSNTLFNDDMEMEQTETTSNIPRIEEKSCESIENSKKLETQQTITDAEPTATLSNSMDNEMMVDEVENSTTETKVDLDSEQKAMSEVSKETDKKTVELEQKRNESTNSTELKLESSAVETNDSLTEGAVDEIDEVDEVDEEQVEQTGGSSGKTTRGMPRRNARRARGRKAGGGSTRARVVSTKIYGSRRNQIIPVSVENNQNNVTLEETIQSESEESPQKTSTAAVDIETKADDTQTVTTGSETTTNEATEINSGTNIRVSARIKARASSGRNRQFPYTDDYVDLDDLEKQTKAANASSTSNNRRSSRGGRNSTTPQKRISLRQQPAESSESPDEKATKQKSQTETNEDMDTGGENEEPNVEATGSVAVNTRKRKSTTPVSSTTTKRTRSTAQATSTTATHSKTVDEPTEVSSDVVTTPKRTRKSTRTGSTPAETSEKAKTLDKDRPVRIALSSHLNFDQTHFDALRQMGFEIMDESCQVDALVVDRIRRTKKFFMCLARGAHILSPTWIEAMMKEKSYVPYEKYYLEDTAAETRYGFQLRESVRLAKQHPIFQNYRFFCTKDTSPPYDDLKDIIEAAGGKLVEKVNMSRPGKDLICIVAQNHKNEYEELNKKGVPIVSEEFALSGVSKQKLDFSSFTLFPNSGTIVKSVTTK